MESVIPESWRPAAITAALATTLTGCGLAAALAGCGPGPPPAEPELRQVLDELVAAIERKDPGAVLDHVDYRFEEAGGLRYPDVEALVLSFLLPDAAVGARLEAVRVSEPESDGSRRVRARVRFASGTRLLGRSAPPPDASIVYGFDLVFRRTGGPWQAVRGSYERIEPPPGPSSGGSTTRASPPATSSSVPGAAASRRT